MAIKEHQKPTCLIGLFAPVCIFWNCNLDFDALDFGKTILNAASCLSEFGDCTRRLFAFRQCNILSIDNNGCNFCENCAVIRRSHCGKFRASRRYHARFSHPAFFRHSAALLNQNASQGIPRLS